MDIYSIANQMRQERKSIYDLALRVTYYARVSSKTDEQLNSVENQKEHFEELIKKNKNWKYIKGYVDEIRGESAENREDFQRMISDALGGKFDLIITKEVSRFARDTLDSLTYTRELFRNGVGVYFLNDNICTIDTDSEMRLTIMSSVAQDEVRKLSERVKFGHARSIQNGVVLGNSRIFGYDKDDGKLIINESEAEMVRQIFELYSTGEYSSREVQKILYERGYRSRKGTEIQHNTIRNIIENPKYKGYYVGGKVKITDYRTKQQFFVPPEEWIMYKDESGEIVPQIIDEATWEKANRVLAVRSEAIKDRSHSFKKNSPFTGLIWCVGHDKPYWRTSYTPRAKDGQKLEPVYQWLCSYKKENGAKTCSSIPIYETELYSLFKTYFLGIADDIGSYVEEFISIYEATDTTADSLASIDKINIALDRTNAKKDKLLDLYVDERITKDEFTKRNDVLNKQVEELSKELNDLKNAERSQKDYIKAVKEIRKFFMDTFSDESVYDMDDNQLDDLVRILVERINVVPIDDKSMHLTIQLKMGISGDVKYQKLVHRSGHISKKMIQQYENSLK